jgi:exopolysaccharide biosynthesis polyprenyl glycosylphosphotransferase
MSARQNLAGGAAERAVAEVGGLRGATGVGVASRSVLRERHGHRDYVIRRVLAAGDAGAIVLALLVAASLDARPGSNLDIVSWGLLTLPVWAVLFKLYGLYDRDLKRVSHSTVDDLPWLFHALVVGTLLMWLFFKGVPAGPLPFASLMGFALTALLGAAALRTFVRSMAIRVLGAERVVLVGSERMTQVLVRKMRSHREYGLEPVGVVLPGESDRAPDGLEVLNGSGDIAEIALRHHADRLVLSHSDLEEDQVLDIVRRCQELAIKVSLLPQVFDALGPSVEIDDVEGVTLLGINPPVLGRSSRVMKRCLDVAGAGVLILFLLPMLLVIAIAIKIDSRGPVFFHQSRVGKGGKRFGVLKLRTMYRDAEQRREELLAESIDPHWLHLRNDPRITRVGRHLRHLSLDELPQLWNVLRGEMSLVGPRPLIESEDEMIGGWGRSRLDLTPGMTGVWQVLGRTNIPFDEMVKLDYLYVTNWSLWTDISLILRTLPAVVTQRGVN